MDPQTSQQYDCALDLMRRLPPQNTEENLAKLIDVVPHLTEEVLSAVDQPLKVRRCNQSGKDYLICEYNRDADSYRSKECDTSNITLSDALVKATRPGIIRLIYRPNRSPWSNEFDPELPEALTPPPKLRKLEIQANEAFDTYREMYVYQ
ncbi:capping protein muscle Z-line, beta [Endogone sp. FLAS-F59071]|nr:capping protein muscle Z-line, beta [Endogone sp. FLAS-F59071]|eukprot:RUS20954.1 capping protein muscle Z-line, beta [Endogone sp. FLAS-F59071]